MLAQKIMPTRERKPLQNISLSVSASLAARQITETGLADLGDWENLSSPNELELKQQGEVYVVLAKLGAIVRREEIKGKTARRIKADRSQINKFVLSANGPMRAKCVLHAAAHKPVNVGIFFFVARNIWSSGRAKNIMKSRFILPKV